MIDAPFQSNINQLEKDEFLECLIDLWFAEGYCGEEASLLSYFESYFGHGITERFLRPYNEKLYCCSLDELNAYSMREFLPVVSFSAFMEKISGKAQPTTYNDSFLYPQGGCEEIIEALATKLPVRCLRCSEEVLDVDVYNKQVITSKNIYHYDYLINTAPLPKLMEWCGWETDCFSSNKILVLNLGFDTPSLDRQATWIYFPGEEPYYRIGFYSNVLGEDRLSMYVECAFEEDALVCTDDVLRDVLLWLERDGIITANQKLIAHNEVIINPGYVHINEEALRMSYNFLYQMQPWGIYSIGRYGKWEYSAMDDSYEQAMQLARII